MNEQALQTNIKTCFECGEDIFHHYSCKNFPKRWARIDAKPQFRGWIEGRKMTEHQAKKRFCRHENGRSFRCRN
jgi:hypothetical protein